MKMGEMTLDRCAIAMRQQPVFLTWGQARPNTSSHTSCRCRRVITPAPRNSLNRSYASKVCNFNTPQRAIPAARGSASGLRGCRCFSAGWPDYRLIVDRAHSLANARRLTRCLRPDSLRVGNAPLWHRCRMRHGHGIGRYGRGACCVVNCRFFSRTGALRIRLGRARFDCRQKEARGILRDPFKPYFKMKMRAGGAAGVAYLGDFLPALDDLTRLHMHHR